VGSTAVLVLADGSVFWGYGLGAGVTTVGEICFNTSMTGYQEIITDPSYAGQIITFTFPHIGNIGANKDDLEHKMSFARGIIIRANVSNPSNYRSTKHFSSWLESLKLTGICGVDTRKLTKIIRKSGSINGTICYSKKGIFNIRKLLSQAQECSSLIGQDLAKSVSCKEIYSWTAGIWKFAEEVAKDGFQKATNEAFHIIVIDYGVKKNILRNLIKVGCKVTVVPATTSADIILKLNPDGIFLSNGPGDPAATAKYAVPVIKTLLDCNKPIFGICLGHQLLALALGAQTEKMKTGHRGGNHPVKELTTGKIEITSQNHGFVVSEDSLPHGIEITHRSLFDGSIEGFKLIGKPIFSVQYHPEASPGPTESDYLFGHFIKLIQEVKSANHA
jgi:carbamoyl-phosphate synthase small subunit